MLTSRKVWNEWTGGNMEVPVSVCVCMFESLDMFVLQTGLYLNAAKLMKL